MSRPLVLTSLALGLGLWVAAPLAQGGDTMNKSLKQFTIGDLFPPIAAGLGETSAAWKTAADSAKSLASARSQKVHAAIGPAKDALDKAKDAASAAKKSKDFAAAGVAEGEAKTDEIVVGLLDRLKDVADRQEDVANAWAQAADQMRRFSDIDKSFDKYRSAGIARPESGQSDTRLSPEGYEAFKNHASAVKDLGAALSQLGNKLSDLASDRLKFASDLEKGGHIKSK